MFLDSTTINAASSKGLLHLGDMANFPNVAAPYSVSFWAKVRLTNYPSGNQGSTIQLGNSTDWTEDAFMHIQEWSDNKLLASFNRNMVPYPARLDPVYWAGSFKKFVYVRTSPGGFVYVDGELALEDNTYALQAAPTYSFILNTAWFTGTVGGYMSYDGITFWNRALTRAEAAQESRSRRLMPVTLQGCLSVWDFQVGRRTGTDNIPPIYSAKGAYTAVGGFDSGVIELEPATVIDYFPYHQITLPNSLPFFGAKLTTRTTRPVADVVSGIWTPSSGLNLYSMINESSYSDTTYIQSSEDPSNDYAVVLLSGLEDPVSSVGHVLSYRYSTDSYPSELSLTIGLYQGDSLIASQVHSGIITSYTAGSFTLSEAQANSITDYTNLRVRFNANIPATAVGYDTIQGTQIIYGTPTTNITVASNNSRALIALVELDGAVLTGVSDNVGGAFTQYGSVYTQVGSSVYVYYFLNPTTGAHTISVAGTGANAGRIFVYSLYNVNQTTPIFNEGANWAGGGGETTLSASIANCTAGMLLLSCINTTDTIADDVGQTLRDSGPSYLASSSTKTGSGAVTMGYNSMPSAAIKIMRIVAVQ